MRISVLFIVAGLFISRNISCQVFTDSNLPIIVINTDNGVEIPDQPRVHATMKIISKNTGGRNYLMDQNTEEALSYSGRIAIELRGSSSQAFDKKQYGFSTLKSDNITVDNVSLLGLPAENDWIINGMVFDTAMIRDYLSYNFSRQIGEYASRTVYCELVINSNYRGLYLLEEKIKADSNRVNVHKIEATDNFVPEVTGGYITKADKTTGGDPVAWNMQADFIHVLPEPEYVTQAQDSYIYSQFLGLSRTAAGDNSSVRDGFPHYIDILSFIDYMIIQELASNADAYQYSTYYHKDRNGKLRAGPVWDNDLTYGNDLFLWGYDRSKTYFWQFSNGDNEGSEFWKDLFNNDVFKCYLSKRWHELTQPGQPLNLSSMESFIDRTVETISEAAERNYARWGIYTSFQDRITFIKAYLTARIDWMTLNLGSYDQCSDVPVPPLVITKIMYNPPESVTFPNSHKQEFLEITNNGDDIVDLTGIYFAGTGFVYQFPENSKIYAHSNLFLANDPEVFQKKYGFTAFGQFTRNLSDRGQDLMLVDGFGNLIDNVSYADTLPWPEASGNGNYLKLKDVALDNNIGSNWTALNEPLFDDHNIPDDLQMLIFPNPVKDFVKILNGYEIKSVTIFDLSGRPLQTIEVNSKELVLDLKQYPRGIYLIRAITLNGTVTRKIVRE